MPRIYLTSPLAILMLALSLCTFGGCSDNSSDSEFLDNEQANENGENDENGNNDENGENDGSKSGDKSDSKDKSGTNKDKKDITVEFSKGTFKDPRDGKTYPTITLDGHTWMAENLDYSKGLDSTVQRPYGTAYLLKEAKKACPDGWHLPSAAEWRELINSVSKDFNYDEAWALKSKTGWANDGNGGDVYGFNVQPGGMGYNGEHFEKDEDIYMYFWTSSDTVPENDVEWMFVYFDSKHVRISYFGYQQEMMNMFVRCISDLNSALSAFGQCDDARKGELNMLDSVYYICTERRDWDRATTQQYLNHEYGECDESNSDYEDNKDVTEINKGIYNDTAFVCKCRRVDWLNECQWYYGTSKDALPPCANKGSKTITTYLDSTFTCYSDTWWPSKVEEIYSECNAEKNGQIVSLNRKKYACYNPTWREMLMPDSAIGICNAERVGTIYPVMLKGLSESYHYSYSYVCEYEYWRMFSAIEEELGYCVTDGEEATVDGYTFECDASKHVWYTTITDPRDGNKYRAVQARRNLWMAEDLRYGGKSRYTWSEALNIPLKNDTLFRTEASDADSVGICPEGWHIPTKEDWEWLADGLESRNELPMLFKVDDSLPVKGRDSYGLSLELYNEDYSGSYWCSGIASELRGSPSYRYNVTAFFKSARDSDTRLIVYSISDGERTTPLPIRCISNEYFIPMGRPVGQ